MYSPEYPDEEYLETPTQFLPLGKHYLKQFRDRIAQYLVLKSLTEKNYFETLISEYKSTVTYKENRQTGEQDDSELTPEQIEERKMWLEQLITHAQKELDTENDE